MNETFYDFLSSIETLKMPKHWEKEDVEPPNDIAKENARNCIKSFYDNYKLKCTCTACTKENGVFLIFKKGKTEIVVETYNNGEVGAIVCKNKEIIYNEDIKDYDFSRCIDAIEKAEQNKI